MTTPDPIDNAASQFQDAGDGYNSWMPPPTTTTTTHACPTCGAVHLPPDIGPSTSDGVTAPDAEPGGGEVTAPAREPS